MQKSLLALMAALPLLMTSAPLRAESATAATVDSTNYSLILRYTGGSGTSMIAVPMSSEEQCEIAGAMMEGSKTFTSNSRNIGFQCIESK